MASNKQSFWNLNCDFQFQLIYFNNQLPNKSFISNSDFDQMGNTYYCTYSNRNTGQQETFECPCDLCWQEWFPNSQNPCPSCSGTASGLDWYYWFLIAIGILLVISLVVSIFVCWRKRKQRSILLVELNNTDRNIVAPQHVPKVENSNAVRNPPTSNNIARTKPQPQQKPQQNSQNVQDKPQAPQVVN